MAYTLFDKPSQIDSKEVGGVVGHSTRYGYGPAREMAYRLDIPQYAGTVSNTSVEVQYFGSVERELRKTATAGQTRETYKRMIGGVLQIVEERVVNDSTASLVSAAVALRSEVLLKDHLGSTHVIVNSDGTNAQYQRFDVWGMRADATTGSTQSISQSYGTNNPTDATKTRTRKGFTGHEMVDGAGIVHMQGRIYDPRLGRFLQADPIIQDPLNGQNYNRYTYVYNNPLSLTDPSGYRSLSANLELYWKPVAAIAIVVVTGGQAYGALAAGGVGAKTAALMWTLGGGAAAGLVTTGTLRGTLTGAFDGVLTFGIGQAYKGSFTALLIAHSLKGGMLEAFNGGEFGHGMLTAGLSKVTGLGVDALERGPVTSIILNAIAGGTVSKVTGGKFANGAVSAALQFAFNQALSGKGRSNQEKRLAAEKRTAAIREKIAEVAQSKLESTEYALDARKSGYKSGDWKCNLFVYDVLTEAGVKAPTGEGGRWPIQANHWGNKDVKIAGWEIVEEPMAGDVVGRYREGESGHVAIYISDNWWDGDAIGAGRYEVGWDDINEDWFMRGFDRDPVYRRYVGNGGK